MPRFLPWLSRISRATLRADAQAAVTGAVIVLPQAIAFAAIAGLPPEYGLYGAMVTPIVAALLGSSMIAVSGPTTAVSALVFTALAGRHAPGSEEWVRDALALTLLVGAIQVAIGVARLGRFLTFVSPSVVSGFSAGAALLIALSQIGPLIGGHLPRAESLGAFLRGLGPALLDVNPGALAVAGTTFSVALALRIRAPRLPGYLVALFVGGALDRALGLGSDVVGPISSVWPRPALPLAAPDQISALAQPALAIAIVGLMQSVTVARSYAMRRDEQLDANREILGQGVSNVLGPFLSAYAGAGSLTRTAVNHEAGGRTPLAALLASAALIAILALVAPLFAHLPIPAMAAVIILVAARQLGLREFLDLARRSRGEALIFLVTFASALAVGLEFAVFAGVILSLARFLNASIDTELEVIAPNPASPNHSFQNVRRGVPECPQIAFGRLNGPLYFGVVDGLRAELRALERRRPEQRHLVLKLTGIGQIDLAGAALLREENARRLRRGGRLHLTSRYAPLLAMLRRYGAAQAIGDENIYPHRHDAIATIVPDQLDPAICARCPTRIFAECPGKPRETPVTGILCAERDLTGR